MKLRYRIDAVFERLFDRLEAVGDRMDRWANGSPTRLRLVWVGLTLVALPIALLWGVCVMPWLLADLSKRNRRP